MAYGYHSSAKTTFFLTGAAHFQRKFPDSFVAFVDAEGLLDEQWAEKLGVNLSKLVVVRPGYGEQAVDIIDHLFTTKSVGLIILDSVVTLVPMSSLNRSAEDDTMAALPRLMGKLCSKLTCRQSDQRKLGHVQTFWYTNQLREKVGVVFGSNVHLPGGRQINHIAALKVWLKLSKEHTHKDEHGSEIPDYNEQVFRIEKTKSGGIKEGVFRLALGHPNSLEIPSGSYDNVPTILDYAKSFGFVTGSGGNWRVLTEKRKRTLEGPFKGQLEDFTVFRKLADIAEWLQSNEEEQHTLARSIIAAYRIQRGYPELPADGYLYSPIGRLVRLTTEE